MSFLNPETRADSNSGIILTGEPLKVARGILRTALLQANADPSRLSLDEHAEIAELQKDVGQSVIEANLQTPSLKRLNP